MKTLNRLLNESAFARTYDRHISGFRKQHYYRHNDYRFIKGIDYFADEDVKCASLCMSGEMLLSLVIFNTEFADKFINEYKVAPYTYVFCCDSKEYNGQNIKPFTYSVTTKTPKDWGDAKIDYTRYPICIRHCDMGTNSVPAMISVKNRKLEYELAITHQNKRFLTTKSAKQ